LVPGSLSSQRLRRFRLQGILQMPLIATRSPAPS
jgi:hypothetical protein